MQLEYLPAKLPATASLVSLPNEQPVDIESLILEPPRTGIYWIIFK